MFKRLNNFLPKRLQNNRGSWGAIVSAVVGVAGSYLASKKSSGGSATEVGPSAPTDPNAYSPQGADGYVTGNPDYVSKYFQDTRKGNAGRPSGNFFQKGGNVQKYFPGMFGGTNEDRAMLRIERNKAMSGDK